MQNRPTYAIESVDRALRLAALLQQEGSIRVSDAAGVLGISVSGAHRLLATLVYRGFAEQFPDRSYGPGGALRPAEPADAPVTRLRQVGPPRLRSLVDRVGESANLMIRVGSQVRFLSTIEADRALRVGDRAGRSLPAQHASGGKALLATLPRREVSALFAGTHVDLTALHAELERVRHEGYATNHDETEDGVTAIGMAVCDGGTPTCAVSIGLPTARFRRAMVPSYVDALRATVAEIEHDLATTQRDAPGRDDDPPVTGGSSRRGSAEIVS